MVQGLATTFNLPNYTGALFRLGQTTTPFLNLIGGISGGNVRTVNSTEFALNQNWKTNAPKQPAISEKASATAPEATHYKREQEYNVVQIFQEAVDITYSKMGDANTIAGINVLGGEQPVQNELDFQIKAHLAQTALDANYTFLKGTYAKAATAEEANQSRGILTAITTNVVDNTSAVELTKDMMQKLFRTCADNGMNFDNAAIFVNSYNKQKVSDIYGLAPDDRNVGGVNINQIETDFGRVMIVYEPLMEGELGLFDMSKIRPVTRIIPNKGYGVFYEPLAKVGASERGQLYGELGLDYASEAFHGKITNLVKE